MHKITGKQCKAARSLLKWNVNDLCSRLGGIPAKRIETFERGVTHIQEWESDEIVKTLKKEGIEFRSDFEVALKSTSSGATHKGTAQGQGARIVLGGGMNVLSDSTLAPAQGVATVEKEEKEKHDEDKSGQ